MIQQDEAQSYTNHKRLYDLYLFALNLFIVVLVVFKYG